MAEFVFLTVLNLVNLQKELFKFCHTESFKHQYDLESNMVPLASCFNNLV